MTAGGSTRVTMLTGACLLQVTPSIWAAYTLEAWAAESDAQRTVIEIEVVA